ncbi:CSTOS-like protein [Mya arenaria]|uniref:Protein CUSTOS n=1 Tax=Mya arenaria TaxID=6604 RepID=A0ABY7E1F5_MYAAR|nr:protein CUSTOS-like [Mya arenaria]WAR03828.1 CSTOS-like protein [Mya arenaria]
MAAPVESDLSSSSDENEDLAKIKEAVESSVAFFTGSKVQTNQANQLQHDETENKTHQNIMAILPSNRPDLSVEEDEGNHLLSTTPGFRRHVAAKLIKSLDNLIDSSSTCFQTTKCQQTTSNSDHQGIRLFHSSSLFISASENQPKQPSRRKRPPSSSDSSSEDERLAEASISHERIVEQSRVPYHSNMGPADVIIVRNTVPDVHNGCGSDSVHVHNGRGESRPSTCTDMTGLKDNAPEALPKKKHKKKKKQMLTT